LQSKSSVKLFVTGEAAQNYCLAVMQKLARDECSFAASHYCQNEQKKQSRARLSLQLNFSVQLFLTGEAVRNYRNATKQNK
jgi:hypothetical protein